MAFQTSLLRDGEWVTETVYLQAALKASGASKAVEEPQNKPPACGLLARTVIDSPIVHWVLPVRLRSKRHNDVAFIGSNFVQISEVDDDGQVHEVLRKDDFDLRIRNAVVLGHGLARVIDNDEPDDFIKPERHGGAWDCSAPVEDTRAWRLPPQYLALSLESGDMVFLFIRASSQGRHCPFEFVTKVESSRGQSNIGQQLAVDPSSRYLAASAPDGILVIYELKSMLALNLQYSQHGTFNPVEAAHLRAVHGVIHKLDFLYPRPQDDHHIILLLFIVRQERHHDSPVSRTVTYEWELGDSIRAVFGKDKSGTRVPMEHSLPNLLIPLKFQSALLIISPGYIDLMKDVLSGSPVFERLRIERPSKGPLHTGLGEPLWTASSRAFRLKAYSEQKDIIYLAREDGTILHLDFDSADLGLTVLNLGAIDTNIDTAFGVTLDRFSDVLIVGGDSGPGAVWRLSARTSFERVSVIANWAPVLDATTTSEASSWSSEGANNETRNARQPGYITPRKKPEAIFTASGRGLQGTVTEWRTGIQARVGLDIETEEVIRQAWAFSEDDYDIEGLQVLLAVPQGTVVLRFSPDLSQATALTPGTTPFDLAASTLYATVLMAQLVVQITETSVTLVTPTQSSRFLLQELLEPGHDLAQDAFCKDNIIVMSSISGGLYHLHTLEIDQMKVSRKHSWDVEGEVTCISLFTLDQNQRVVASSMVNGMPRVSVYTLEGSVIQSESFALHRGTDLIAGTRCGHILTIRLQTERPITWSLEEIADAPIKVTPAYSRTDGLGEALACFDGRILMMRGLNSRTAKFGEKHFVWLTDSNDALASSPPIDSVYSLRHSLSRSHGRTSILAIAGSRVLLTEIWPRAGPVPRCIPVAAFVDAETGEVISSAMGKNKKRLEHISGLGRNDDRIHGLYEWLCVKDGKTFAFIIVTTQSGQLLVVSVESIPLMETRPSSRRLAYWTRYKKRFGAPVYSVVGDADGLIFCVKNIIYWDVLDLAEKKLKPIKEFELDSPATSLQVKDGKILALTTGHSLQIIDHRSDKVDGEMMHLHGDSVARSTMHMIEVGDAKDSEFEWPIFLLSDVGKCSVAGVWVSAQGSQRNKELTPVIEGRVPSAVRRFVRAHSRPAWATTDRQRKYGTLLSSVDGAEVLGLTLVGSMQHFTLISIDLWRLLSLLQNLARRNPVLSPFTHVYSRMEDLDLEPRALPGKMLIDGDLLERCLKQRALETLLEVEESYTLFCNCLDGLEGGKYTEKFVDGGDRSRAQAERYIALGYDILEYLSSPVL
ncbi:hypothetical protein S7711_00718 [Stachybotrys chartarum IBT 7711]|uniref:RSE1/DDB1/CPSF1 first beta-propeller domain-containing protein n=1 Tax=Stachybotrys chartarum (strain CBS 109288 / IBT 7711) TaxID=1280523 RepID=A0A084AZZ3_STACB|nr:hypothetical protein S7711_00718 [Stachybotrys chartarum IBT 7711]